LRNAELTSVRASPTPFYSLVRLSAWTGYQQGSTCISMSQYGPYTSTATFDPNVGFGSDGPIAIDGNIDYLRLNASPAFIYTGNLSNWVVEVNDIGAGESNIQFPPDFPKILQDVPALRSQFADFSSITIPTVWLGAPTALVSAAEVTAPSSTVIRMPGNYPTSGAEQLTPSTTTSVAVQTSGSEAGWTTYPTSTITQEQTPTTLQSDIASATLDVASIQPDSTSSTSSLTFLTNTPPALTNTAVSEMLSTTIPDESTGTTPASSSAFLRSTAVADIDASQQTNLAPASNGIDNTDGSTPTTSDQSVVSQSSAAGIGDFVASVLGMGSSTAAAAQIPDIGATKTGSQGLTQMQSSVGGEALSESIEAASAIAAMIPVGTGMPDVSPPAPGTLKQGPPTSSQYLGTKPSASASGPSFTNSPLGTALSNIAISTDAQADSTGIYIGSNLLSPSSTIIASDLTFLYAPPESTVLIEYGSTTITYTPSAQPYSIQPASPSTSIHTEPTTGEALLDASGDSITSVPTSGQAMLGASSATLTLGTSSLAREGSSVESTAQALALTQASSTYYLVHSHGSLVVIGSQTLSVGGPAATIGTELVSIASTAIIVNGRSTIPIAGASAAATASHVSSIARASTAGLTKSNGAESAATEGASPTAAGSRHAATSGGVGRFHEAPRAAALAVCFFALVYSCVR